MNKSKNETNTFLISNRSGRTYIYIYIYIYLFIYLYQNIVFLNYFRLICVICKNLICWPSAIKMRGLRFILYYITYVRLNHIILYYIQFYFIISYYIILYIICNIYIYIIIIELCLKTFGHKHAPEKMNFIRYGIDAELSCCSFLFLCHFYFIFSF